MTRRAAIATAALVACVATVGARQTSPPAGPGDWRPFSATWSARGPRAVVPTGGDRPAAILRLSGAVVVTQSGGMRRGFLGEAVAYDDGGDTTVGRAVWTDDAGDQIYSELSGETVASGRRIRGVVTGGTGRYAGLEGEYAFTWQTVLPAEDGVVQGRTAAIEGRVRGGRR